MRDPTFIHYLDTNSIFKKAGFFTKFSFFLLISVFGVINRNPWLNLALAVLILFLLVLIRFDKWIAYKSLGFAIAIFCLFWLTLSSIDGEMLFSLPWGTFVSDNTLRLMLLAASRWTLVVLSGILFVAITSESELINSLLSVRAPYKLIFTLTIAFNTIGFSLMDIQKSKRALESRGFMATGIKKKLQRILYIGIVILLSNFKKIETLSQSYMLREDDFKNRHKKTRV